jgi:hypothetical protein
MIHFFPVPGRSDASESARTATAAMSRSSIGAASTAPYGHRTTSPARI